MAPLVRDTTTNVVTDVPQNILDHRILGAHLVPWDESESDEYELDKVVDDSAVSTQRLSKTATPKKD